MGLLTKIIIGAVAKKTALKIHENVEEKDKQERSLEEVISSCMFENILIAKDNKTAVIGASNISGVGSYSCEITYPKTNGKTYKQYVSFSSQVKQDLSHFKKNSKFESK